MQNVYVELVVWINCGLDKFSVILQIAFSNAFCCSENFYIFFCTLSIEYTPESQVNDLLALVQILAWH